MKSFIICCLLFFTFTLNAQDYIAYYNLVNEGNKSVYYKKYDVAVMYYEQALDFVSYVHNNTYANLALAYSHLGNNKKAIKYLEKAVKQGWNRDITITNAVFSPLFTETQGYKNIMINEKVMSEPMDSAYIRKIDSLYAIDQYIIRANNTFKENTVFSDSFNLAALLRFINKQGFPSENIVGQNCVKKVEIIIHHNGRLEKNERLLPIWLEAVKKGWLAPESYAWMYDQYLTWEKKQKPRFYQGIARIDKFTPEELAKINNIRFTIGLPSLDAYDIRGDDNSISFSKKY
jgi:hypothetical protein